ncbi:TetR/AcrR family transcriptional regulator [Streptomyces longwoodensis]|uniref:TetR/AcrR family transcriptional regulator n=1 Tax=Streptomyces longwoodensis TaxID=68231 RepID=UPI0033C50EE2
MAKGSTKERLPQATFSLFGERGYEQTAIDDVAERVGVGPTPFFRHYWMGDTGPSPPLRTELMTANVVAARDQVLRHWLRGEPTDHRGH